MWVYMRAEESVSATWKKEYLNKWVVGFFGPTFTMKVVAAFSTEEEAASRVHYLNGGNDNLTI